jgi:hypothetical protein
VRGYRDVTIRNDRIHRIGRDFDQAGHATTGVTDELVLREPRPAFMSQARAGTGMKTRRKSDDGAFDHLLASLTRRCRKPGAVASRC